MTFRDTLPTRRGRAWILAIVPSGVVLGGSAGGYLFLCSKESYDPRQDPGARDALPSSPLDRTASAGARLLMADDADALCGALRTGPVLSGWVEAQRLQGTEMARIHSFR